MAIKLNDGTVLRNLEEQVQYLTSYHDENLGIAQWGIRVIDRIDDAQDLPVPYDGEYGDAIAVGTEAPFFFYIWTRNAIAGEPGYWFPYGEISIAGPEGPKGDKGDKGDTGESTRWFSGQTPSPGKVGDQFLDTSTGNVFQHNGTTWVLTGNIRGPKGIQGEQGKQGEKGDKGSKGDQGPEGKPGKFVTVAGILANVNQLPTPASLNDLSLAYLVGSTAPYNLYVQVGLLPAIAVWTNVGPFNVGTVVTVHGTFATTFDADLKVDKKTVTSEQILTIKPNGETDSLAFNFMPAAYAIPRYTNTGQLKVQHFPEEDDDAASRSYVDTAIGNATPEADYAAELTFEVGPNNVQVTYTFSKIMWPGLAINAESYIGAVDEDNEMVIIGYNLHGDCFLVMDMTDTNKTIYSCYTYNLDV